MTLRDSTEQASHTLAFLEIGMIVLGGAVVGEDAARCAAPKVFRGSSRQHQASERAD